VRSSGTVQGRFGGSFQAEFRRRGRTDNHQPGAAAALDIGAGGGRNIILQSNRAHGGAGTGIVLEYIFQQKRHAGEWPGRFFAYLRATPLAQIDGNGVDLRFGSVDAAQRRIEQFGG
jgi:hypothetical protein